MSEVSSSMKCRIAGIGAYGTGFRNWAQLSDLLTGKSVVEADMDANPRPEIIPANERRRAPLIVRLAVESSWQAAQQAQMDPASLSCVFVSGLGDTELGDYCCRELAKSSPQLSPTKFHNSVHNAPAGYWTISTGCMKAASTIAGFQRSVGLTLLEALTQCAVDKEPLLVTFVDTPVALVQRDMLINDLSFAFSMVLLPDDALENSVGLRASITPNSDESTQSQVTHELPQALQVLYHKNPSAHVLILARQLALRAALARESTHPILMSLSEATNLELHIE